jgi:hypothetical protein
MLRAPILVCLGVFLLAACNSGPKNPAEAATQGDMGALKQFLKAPEPQIRTDALGELAKLAAQNPEAQKLFISDALGSPQEDVWKGALSVLLERAVGGDPWAVEAFKGALDSSRQEVQIEAIKTLQKKGGTAAKPFLSEFANVLADTDADVFTAASEALKAMGEDGWPVVKEALASNRPSIRQKGTLAAEGMMETTTKHLDDIVSRYVLEDDEEARNKLGEILVKSEAKALGPLLRAMPSIPEVKKRLAIYDEILLNGVANFVEKEQDKKDPKKEKVTIKYRCPEILAEFDTILATGEKATDEEREKPAFFLYKCTTGKENQGKPETKQVQEKLQELVKAKANTPEKRRFALYTLCATTGSDKDMKAWLKGAQGKKSDEDEKMKGILKKEGC